MECFRCSIVAYVLTPAQSNALAFGPANGNRTYGGHVYMQAAYAAAQTVAEGMVLHVSLARYVFFWLLCASFLVGFLVLLPSTLAFFLQ